MTLLPMAKQSRKLARDYKLADFPAHRASREALRTVVALASFVARRGSLCKFRSVSSRKRFHPPLALVSIDVRLGSPLSQILFRRGLQTNRFVLALLCRDTLFSPQAYSFSEA